jgi:F0F1-type ATP synthase assembly protein I
LARLIIPTIRNKAYQLVYWPALIAFIFAALLGIYYGNPIWLSILSGITIWVLPHFYFAYRVFSKIQTNAKQFMIGFYRAEIIKLSISAIVFIIINKFFTIAILPLLIGYMLAQVSFWIFAFLYFS